jgi:hypothetical protein
MLSYFIRKLILFNLGSVEVCDKIRTAQWGPTLFIRFIHCTVLRDIMPLYEVKLCNQSESHSPQASAATLCSPWCLGTPTQSNSCSSLISPESGSPPEVAQNWYSLSVGCTLCTCHCGTSVLGCVPYNSRFCTRRHCLLPFTA